VSRERDRLQEPAPVVDAVPGAPPLPTGPISPASVLALQRSAGNEAVTRALAGRAPLGVHRSGLLDLLHGEETVEAHERLEEFRKTPCSPLVNHKPSSGLGQFDVTADMAAGTMTVTLKVAYNFVDGDPSQVPKGFRPEEFKWQEAEKTTWKTQYQNDVSSLWSAKFQMKSTEKHWESMVVDTTVSVVEDAASPHFTLTVAKYPPDAAMVQSSICPPGYHHDGSGNCAANAAGDGTGTASLDSNDMRPEQKLDWGNPVTAINFSEGGAALDAAANTALTPIVTALKGKPEAHVELTGRASNTHKRRATADSGAIDNMDLARQRSAAVRQALLDAGVTAEQILVRNEGENGAGPGREWCRVDAQVGTHQTQDPALHETGHMLGNEDEYTSTGSAAGSAMPAKYDAMVKAQTGDVVTHVDDASVMSMGSTVRRWNYAAFLEALKEISKKQEWTL
jgi:outer membrane protein OmpA-like peptidoglycan-associated protein